MNELKIYYKDDMKNEFWCGHQIGMTTFIIMYVIVFLIGKYIYNQ